ncbi:MULTISPECIES: hypothetical protein [unclassified Sphingomonas]|uniref:hypothetical protein n=1 Tax=Sphingomonas TaxID=13687 RepID=UPI001AD2FAC8|nr:MULTISPECIES: hypothetical protein [unclassified Sphingomonas]MBN8812487.1 hypothetical protein [Sphingomonas sp.]
MSGRWRTLALVLVVLGAMAWAITQVRPAGPQNPLTDPASVERELLADRPGGLLSATIKRTFPEDFEALKTVVAERARAGGGPQDIQQAAGAFVGEATRRHRAGLIQAPAPQLRAYLAAEIALVGKLAATSPERCDAYFADPLDDAGWFAPDLRELYLRQNIALWEAAGEARDHPAGRAASPAEARPAASCDAGLAALEAIAALPPARFEQVYPQLLATGH